MGYRSWTILAIALSLGGCNMVTSKRPLFTPADTHDTPVFKAGLWASDDPACTFDVAKPKAEWPECAGGSAIPAGQGVLHDEGGTEVLIAMGDPLIIQIHPAPTDGKAGGWFYGAVRPIHRDAQGQVTSVESWPIECGPPPPEPKPSTTAKTPDPKDFVTKQPLPGLKIDGGNCLAVDPKVVRSAALANLAWQKPQKSHWVRAAD
jgi:hypothetical protein